MSTIYYNKKKSKKISFWSILEGIEDLKKITASAFHTLSQYVRHDTSFPTRTLARKLKNTGEKYNIEQLEVIFQVLVM